MGCDSAEMERGRSEDQHQSKTDPAVGHHPANKVSLQLLTRADNPSTEIVHSLALRQGIQHVVPRPAKALVNETEECDGLLTTLFLLAG